MSLLNIRLPGFGLRPIELNDMLKPQASGGWSILSKDPVRR